MKKLKLSLIGIAASVLAMVTFSGCGVMSKDVPQTEISGQVAGQKFKIKNPKDTVLNGFSFEVATNGTAHLTISNLSTVMNPSNITATGSSEASIVSATGDAITKAVSGAAAAAAQFTGSAAKAAAVAP